MTPVADGYLPLRQRRATAAGKLWAMLLLLLLLQSEWGEVVDLADTEAAQKELAEVEEESKAMGFPLP